MYSDSISLLWFVSALFLAIGHIAFRLDLMRVTSVCKPMTHQLIFLRVNMSCALMEESKQGLCKVVSLGLWVESRN